MFYSYYELTNIEKEYIIEMSFDNASRINSAYLKMYGLDVYYVKDDGEVIYPLVYESTIEFNEEIFPLDSYKISDLIKEKILVNNDYYNYFYDDACCDKVYGSNHYYEESIIDKLCKEYALTCISCHYDIDINNKESWTVRRNGQLIATFNPKDFLECYDPGYDGGDKFCYLGDFIIVKHIDPDVYAINREQSNYLSYRLHNLGMLWLQENNLIKTK